MISMKFKQISWSSFSTLGLSVWLSAQTILYFYFGHTLENNINRVNSKGLHYIENCIHDKGVHFRFLHDDRFILTRTHQAALLFIVGLSATLYWLRDISALFECHRPSREGRKGWEKRVHRPTRGLLREVACRAGEE